MFGIPLRRYLFGRQAIPGTEEAAPAGLPPPQDLGALEGGQPPDISVPEDVGAVEGGEMPPQVAAVEGGNAAPEQGPVAPPQAPQAPAAPIIPPAIRGALTREPLPTPPTFEPLPKFPSPHGWGILAYGIPGYAQGKAARFEHEQAAVKYANELKARTYTEQLAADREARMIDSFQESVRTHVAKEDLASQANVLRKNAEFNRLMGRGQFAAQYFAGRSDLSESEKEAAVRKSLGLATTQQLNYATLLDMAGGDPSLIETLPDEVKKMFGALPPAGAQPSTTTHYGGVDYFQDPATGKWFSAPKAPSVSVRTPGAMPPGAAPVQPTVPATGGPAPFEPISLKAVTPGTVADPETERQIRSLAAQGGRDPNQLAQEMGYAPLAAPAGTPVAAMPVPATAVPQEVTGPGGRPLIPGAKARPLTDQQKEKLTANMGALDNTIDLTRRVLKNSNILDSLITAGKIQISISPDKTGLVVSRMATLTPQEAQFAADIQSLTEHINTLRGPLGATGFRGHEAFTALQAQRGNLLGNPEITRNVLRTTLQALLGQKSAAYISLAKSEGRPYELDDDTIRAYLDATAKNPAEAKKLAQRQGWIIK